MNVGSRHQTLATVLQERAAFDGSRQAFALLKDGTFVVAEMSCAGLDSRARAIAAALSESARVGDRALLLLDHNLDYIAAIFGCLYAGVVAVPCQESRSRRSTARLDAIASDAQPSVIIAASGTKGKIARASCLHAMPFHWLEVDADEPPGDAGLLPRQSAPGDVAVIQYTSGSTADPKGVVLTHANILANVEMIRGAFLQSSNDVVVSWLPFFHDMGLIGTVMHPLITGCPSLLIPPAAFLAKPVIWLRAVSSFSATTSGGPNFAFDHCVDRIRDEDAQGLDLSSWRVAFNGSEFVHGNTLKRFSERFRPHGFRKSAWCPCYGLAEATLLVTAAREAEDNASPRASVLCGAPAAGVRVAIVDEKSGEECPAGAVGEIWVQSPAAGVGYWNRPRESEETFRAYLANGDGPFVRTGDLGRYEGSLIPTGRIKELIVLRGRNHHPRDLEIVALEAAAGAVSACAAFATSADADNGACLTCEVRGREGLAELEDAIRRAIAEQFELAMDDVIFVRSGLLPRTANGKLRRLQCRDLYLAGKLSALRPSSNSPYEGKAETRDPLSALRRLVESKIGRLSDHDLDAPLISLGLDSLALTRVFYEVEELSGVRIRLYAIPEDLSLRDLASSIECVLPAGDAEGREPPEEIAAGAGQQAMWALHHLDPGRQVCNIGTWLRCAEPLDVARFDSAVRSVIQRHPALASTFSVRDGCVVQRFSTSHIDLSVAPIAQVEIGARMQVELMRAFDLERGPLIRFRIFSSSEAAIVLISTHHLVADLWSLSVITHELERAYHGRPCEGYDRCAELGRKQQRAILREDDAEYWTQILANAGAAAALPRSHEVRASYGSGLVTASLDRSFIKGLRQLCSTSAVTVQTAVLVAFEILLWRVIGERRFLIGLPIDVRDEARFAATVSCGVNLCPLPVRIDPAATFGDFMKGVRRNVLDAITHSSFPVDTLRAGGQRLSHICFSYESDPFETDERLWRWQPAMSAVSQFDLSLTATESHGDISFRFEYSTDLFGHEQVERWRDQLLLVLGAMVSDPERRLGDVALVDEAEARRLVHDNNRTERDYGAGLTLAAVLEGAADRHGAAVAVEEAGSGRRLSYAELHRQANRVAHWLQSQGAGPEQLVAVEIDRSLELVVALLGVIKSGAAYLPLDPQWPALRRRQVLEEARPCVVLTRDALAQAEPWPCSRPPLAALPGHLAYVIYTSGSTGVPKGVAVPQNALMDHLGWVQELWPVGPGDRILQKHPVTFDGSMPELFQTLAAGARLVVPPPGPVAGRELTGLLVEHEISGLDIATAALDSILEDAEALRDLRWLVCGGQQLGVLQALQLEQVLPGRVYNEYGPTEATVGAVYWRIENAASGVCIGHPEANTRIYVLDEAYHPVPCGVAGELYIAGAGLARGYICAAGLTAERFLPDPFGPAGSRMYRTGDLGRWRADGNLEFLGRRDSQVKLRGFRIELGEIEAALEEHPGVAQAAAVMRDDALVAWIVARAPAPEARELRGWLAERLPDYMLPSRIVEIDRLPLSAHGKLDRNGLPAPPPATAAVVGEVLTPGQELVASMMAAVVGRERAGKRENFFELGGHSLKATQLVARLREAFGVELPLRAVFEAPTAEGLAERIDELRRSGQAGAVRPPLVARGASEWPLSFAQRRLWFLANLEPGSGFYNCPAAVRLKGALDSGRLEHALAALMSRHEVLRMQIVSRGGEPWAVIGAAGDYRLEVIEVGDEAELERIAAAEAGLGFAVEGGPLVRTRLLRLAADEHVLLVTLHHLVCDGWSLGLLVEELGRLYAGESLPALALQYGDWAAWQRQHVGGEVLASQVEWWRGQLAGAPQTIDWPLTGSRPLVQSYRGASLRLNLGEELSGRLHGLCREQGVTLHMALTAAFGVLLWRLSGQRDFLVGTAVAGRSSHAELEPLVGLFVNLLPLRLRLQAAESFAQLLRRVRETALDAYAHQDVPFEKLVEELEPVRDLSRHPLFQALVLVQNAPASRSSLGGGLVADWVEVANLTSKYDLTLTAVEAGRGIAASLEYSTDLFGHEQVERWRDQLLLVLGAMVSDPERRLGDVALVDEAEARRLVHDNNRTERDYGAGLTLAAVLEGAADRHGAAVAVEEAGSGRRLSYAELHRQANRVAHWLQSQGAGPEQLVAVEIDRSLELVVALLGVIKSGAAYLPLDPQWPALRRRQVLEEARPCVVLTRDALAQAEPWPCSRPPLAALPGHLAYVIYTSGSTGVPKGVAVPQRAVLRLLRGADYARFGSDETFLHLAPLAFDASTFEIWGALLHGARLLLAPAGPLACHEIAGLLEQHRVSTLWLTAGLFREMASAEVEALGCIAQLLAGGDVLPVAEVGQLRALYPRQRLINGYGPTEATTFSCCYTIEEPPPPTGVPIGRPISNTRIYVLDEAYHPVPCGVAGELYIAGAGLARGYICAAGLTAERFLPDPFGPAGSRMYRTGDLGRWRADGNLEFLGRRDSQVKLRGFRIELGEIEAALEEHPGVAQAAAVMRDDALVAWIVARAPAPEARELRGWLAERLPDYMLPSRIVEIDRLPLSAHGKLDRNGLPAPPPATAAVVGEVLTPGQELVASMMAAVVGRERAGKRENFFELGGHSLKATQLVARLREAFGVELPLRAVFEAPTAEGLAERIDELRRSGQAGAVRPPLVARGASEWPLSFAQRRLWFLANLEPGSGFYNCPAAVRLKGALDSGRLEHALAALMSRHEVLRMQIVSRGGEPWAVIGAAGDYRLEVIEVGDEAELERIAAAEAGLGFAVEGGPLVRTRLLRLAADEHVLLVTLHHLVCDGWSLGLLVEELGRLYAGESLPALALQYGDWAAWQRQHVGGEVLASQVEWWRGQLAGAPQTIDWPLTGSRPLVQSYRGASLRLNLGEELSGRLHGLCREQGVTLHMALTAAFGVLLWRLSGQRDFLVGTAVAGRSSHAELEPLVGLFVNLLPLRLRLQAAESFAQLLRRVRETALDAYAHQDVPFEKLVEELEPVRDLSRHPLFQALVLVQNAPASRSSLGGGLVADWVEVANLTSKYDLTLTAVEAGRGIAASLEYSTDLFGHEQVERWRDQLLLVLGAMVSDPERRLGDVALVDEAEARRLVHDNNRTERDYGAGLTLAAVLEGAADRHGAAVAVEEAGSGRRLSYAELHRQANRVAHWLQSQGAGPEQLVAVEIDRSLELVVALLGVIKSGAAYLPLDPQWPALRRRQVLEEARPCVVLTRDALAQAEPWPCSRPPLAALPGHLAYVIYTSGSTGVPKGVAVPQRAVLRLLRGADYARFGSDETFLHLAPLAFDASTFEIWGALLHGARLLLAPAGPLACHEIAGLLEQHRVSTLWLTAGLFREMASAEVEALGCIAQLLAGGDVLPVAEVGQLRALYPRQRLINGYGPTEATTFSCCYTIEEPPPPTGVPIGRPISNTRIYVLDEAYHPVPCGVAGELYIAGAGLARGYICAAGLTAERFLPDPFGPAGSRMYRTGDLGRWRADGNLEFLGRRDSQVKLRGFRIELGEIEAALEEHPGVAQAAAVMRDDALVAWIVARAPAPEARELRGWLAERLPDYMLPSRIVEIDRLPLSAHGKLDRNGLPAPPPATAAVVGEVLTPGQELVASMMAAVVGRERAGKRENFFELGGHSLKATQLVARLREAFGVELPLRAVFEAPTAEGLAERIDELRRSGQAGAVRPPLVARGASEWPLSFAQWRLWFLANLEPGSGFYNCPAAVRLKGALDSGRLEHALAALMSRHEVLRMQIVSRGGEPWAVIGAAGDYRLEVIEVGDEAELERIAAAEAGLGFAVEGGPLVRTRLLRLAADEHVLLVTLHHLVCDGWSLGLLVEELGRLYAGESLPALALQYGDWAAWQRQHVGGEVLASQVEWWRGQLAGAPQTIDWPLTGSRPLVQSYRGASLRLNLGEELSGRLHGLCREQGVTLHMALTAAFGVLLWRLSGQRDFLVGTAVAGRSSHAELEPLVGLFVNLLPLRLRLQAAESFAQLLRRVRETALDAYAHQDVPFEKLVEELELKRTGRNPLIQVALGVDNITPQAFALGGLEATIVDAAYGDVRFDLTIWVSEHGDDLALRYTYAANVFTEKTIRGFHEELAFIICAVPEFAASSTSLLEICAILELKRNSQQNAAKLTRFAKTPRGGTEMQWHES